mgnify:CR=1 FL=1
MRNDLPFSVMSHNRWERAPRLDAVAQFLINNTIITNPFIAYALAYVGVTAVTSWALKALTPQAEFGDSQGQLLSNSRGATAAQQIVYGEVRKGGTITYMESTGTNNEYLHQIICLAGHEVNSIGDIYINDQVVTLDGSGNVTSSDWLDADGNSVILIKKFEGSATQNVYNDLNFTDGPSWQGKETGDDTNFRGQGIACLYVRLKFDANVFSQGVPLFTAKIQGKKVYDPRNSTTAYSANAALCIRDYLVSKYGLNNSGTTNDTVFSAAANTCDESIDLAVTNAGSFVVGRTYTIKTIGTTDFIAIGADIVSDTFVATGAGSGTGTAVLGSSTTEKRYEINGVISLDRAPSDILGDMMTACAGTLFWGVGQWQLKVGEYTSSVKTFTLDDLRSGITVDTKHSRRDNFNIVRGTFVDANADYVQADYPERKSTTFISNDNGIESAIDLALPLTTSVETAQRLAKMTLFRAREQMTVTADFGLDAFEVQVGDIVGITNSRYGWTAKEFEVVGWKFGNNGADGALTISLTLRETSSSAFSWSAEEADLISNDSTLPGVANNLTISSLTTTDSGRTTTDGTFINTVIVSWSAPGNAFISHYEVEHKATSDSDYAATTTVETSIELSPIVDGQQYDIRVRAVTVSGFRGPRVTTTFTGGGDTTAPSPITNLTATGTIESVTLDWDAPTTQANGTALFDLKGYNIYRHTSNTQPASPIAFVGSDKYIDGALTALTIYYYWIEAVDFSGNASTVVASGGVTTQAAGAAGTSIVAVYADDASGTNKSYTVGSRTFVLYYEYTGSKPAISSITGTWVKFVGDDGADGADGTDGINGSNGARYASVNYYSTSSSTTGLAANVSYTWSTGVATTTYGTWSTNIPTIDAAGSNTYYVSVVTFVDSTGSATTSTGSSASTASSLFNFNGLVTFTNTSGSTDLNTALADSSTIIDGGNIQTGTLSASAINIDNVTLDTNSSGSLIVKGGGIDTEQIALGAVSAATKFYNAGGSFISGITYSTVASFSLSATALDEFFY